MTATGCGRWGGSCFADPALGVKALAQLLPDTGRLLAKAGIYTESGQKHNGLANVYGAGVGGDRDLPAGGQQTLPTLAISSPRVLAPEEPDGLAKCCPRPALGDRAPLPRCSACAIRAPSQQVRPGDR